jgi:hypothetical protein
MMVLKFSNPKYETTEQNCSTSANFACQSTQQERTDTFSIRSLRQTRDKKSQAGLGGSLGFLVQRKVAAA